MEVGFPSAHQLIRPDTYEFDFADNFRYGSFSAKTNWLAKADAFGNGYDLNYDRTLDYIMAVRVRHFRVTKKGGYRRLEKKVIKFG